MSTPSSKRKKITAAAEPDVRAIPPPLQRKVKIRCGGCGGDARYSTHWRRFRYYKCASNPLCVDPETMKILITKVLAD